MATCLFLFIIFQISRGQISTLPICYPQRKCDDGYYDSTNGKVEYESCGENCVGGQYYVDANCNCACKPLSQCQQPTVAPTAEPAQEVSAVVVLVVVAMAFVGLGLLFCCFGGCKDCRSGFGLFQGSKRTKNVNGQWHTGTGSNLQTVQPVVYNQNVQMRVVQQPMQVVQQQPQPVQVMVVTKEQMAMMQAQQGQVQPMIVPVNQPIVQNISAPPPSYNPSAAPPPAYNDVAASAPNHFDDEDNKYKSEGHVTDFI